MADRQTDQEQDKNSIAWKRYEQARPRTAINVSPQALSHYAGTYRFDDAIGAQISLDAEKLMLRMIGQPRVEMFAEAPDAFFLKAVPAQITFTRDGDEITSLTLHQHGLELAAQRCTLEQFEAIEAAFKARGHRTERLPLGEAILQRTLHDLRDGTPDYEAMTALLAALVAEQLPQAQDELARLGDLLSLTFQGVRSDGFDLYTGTFAGGQMALGLSQSAQGALDGFFLKRL